jgi:hypothetical protein
MQWPPRSPDFISLVLYLSVSGKNYVYLLARIRQAVVTEGFLGETTSPKFNFFGKSKRNLSSV